MIKLIVKHIPLIGEEANYLVEEKTFDQIQHRPMWKAFHKLELILL